MENVKAVTNVINKIKRCLLLLLVVGCLSGCAMRTEVEPTPTPTLEPTPTEAPTPTPVPTPTPTPTPEPTEVPMAEETAEKIRSALTEGYEKVKDAEAPVVRLLLKEEVAEHSKIEEIVSQFQIENNCTVEIYSADEEHWEQALQQADAIVE